MSRVVTTARLGTGARRLAAARPDEVDPTVRGLVEAAAAEAYDRGLRDGESRGSAAAEARTVARIDQLGAAVGAALEGTLAAVREERDGTVAAAFDLAVALAVAVLGREPHDGGAAVAARVRDTLDRLEDPSAVVWVSGEDVELVATALGGRAEVTVAADPTLAPGEARVRGGWADADLTHATTFAAIRRELGVDA